MPLAIMLVLTQAGIGATWGDVVLESLGGSEASAASVVVPTLALGVALPGLAASIAHLGRPQWAFRAVLGLRTSWMSREILALGAFAGALTALLGVAWIDAASLDESSSIGRVAGMARTPLAWSTALLGALGLFCSIKIYAATRRPFWTLGRTLFRFVGSAIWASVAAVQVGLAAGATTGAGPLTAGQAALALSTIGLTALRLKVESGPLLEPRTRAAARALDRSRRLLRGPLAGIASLRIRTLAIAGFGGPLCLLLALAVGSGGALLAIACSSLALGLFSDVLERRLFFQAEAMPSMPGTG